MGSGYRRKGASVLDTDTGGDEKPVAKVAETHYNSVVQETRLLRLIYPADVHVEGPVSGKKYHWPTIGHVETVNAEDYDLLLAKHVGGKGCCGADNPNGNKLFESGG